MAVAKTRATRALASLTRIARQFGPKLGAQKLELLAILGRSRLQSPAQVLRLHELLSFLDAFPDDRRVRARVRRMLRGFRHRADLRRHRTALAGTGIVGTDIPYRFFWPTARWISSRWPSALVIDRDDDEQTRALIDALPQLLPPAQKEWLRRLDKPTLAVLDRLKPRGISDADYFISLVAAMPGDDATRESYFDRIDAPFLLRAGPQTPERTTTRFDTLSFCPQQKPLHAPRPDLRRESRRPPRRIVRLRKPVIEALIELARVSMATRERDLAVFEYANSGDAFLVDDGYGLGFAFIGMVPERRILVPAVYGGLTLQNGVPIGYVQLDVLGRHAELSFNQFEAFRGTGAARVFARLVATTRHVFGCDSFSIEPYQLGDGNDEGIDSGAWWFYYRLGFRPRAREARQLASRELHRIRRNPRYRSSARSLRPLARWHLFFSLNPARRARLPRVGDWLQAAIRELRRFPQPEAAARRAAAAVAASAWLGLETRRPGPARVLADWAGLVLALARRGHWTRRERRQLLAVIEAKAGAREIDYLRRVQRHAKFRRALDC
jgi:hypothetical protein